MSPIPIASPNYFDEYDPHEAALQLIRQGKLLYALNDDLEATNDIIASFYAHAKVEQEGALIFMPHLCAPEDVTIYNFHRQLIDKYETIDEHGNSAPKHDYQFFLSNYQTLLQLKQRCALYISPQLWNDQATEYIRQAHFLHHELRKHEYDADCAYIIYNVFKMGYDSPFFKPRGKCALEFLHLACLIQDEFRIASSARQNAEDYGITFSELPGDFPHLAELYAAARLCKIPADPVMWLMAQASETTSSFDKRIKWLTKIQDREADSLFQHKVPEMDIARIKFDCSLLIRFYNRLRLIVLNDENAASYHRSAKPEERFEVEVNILFNDITAEELFAFSQCLCSEARVGRNIQMLQALLESSKYADILVSTSLYECIYNLRIVCNFHEMYQKVRPFSKELERHINDFLADFFRIYTRLRKEQISEDISRSRFSYKKPTDEDCLRRILSESQSCVESLRSNKSVDPSDLELCELYLNYLQDELITPVEKSPMPETLAHNEPDNQAELDLDADLDNSFFEECTIKSKYLQHPDKVAGHYTYTPNEGLVFYANDPSNEHNTEVIFPGIYGAIVKLVLDKRFHDAERQYMNQRYMLHQHVDFCLLDHFFVAYLKFEPAYYESTEVICDLYHWWKIFSKYLQLLHLDYQDLARQITLYLIHYIGVNKSPRPLTPDVIFTEPLADSFTIRWKNLPTPDDLEPYGEEYARLKNLLFEKYAIMDRPSPRYVHGFTETLLVLVAENTREETLRSIKSFYINEEKYPRSYEYADENPLPMIDRISYLFDERDLVFTFARFSPDDIYEAHLRRAKQDLPEYFHSHRILRKDYEGDKIYTHIFKNELLLAATLLEHYCIKPLTYKTRCEIVSYLGMFLVYMADVYDVDPDYKQIRKVLTPLLDQLHSEDISPKLETYDSVLDENGRMDYDKLGANLLANLTEPVNICLKPLEEKLDYTISEDVTPPADAALEYVRPIFHQVDSLLAKGYTPQWIDDVLNYIQEDKSAAFKLQKTSHRVSDRSISLCLGAMMSLGVFGDNKSKNIVETRGLSERTLPKASSVRRDLNKGDYEGSYKAIIQKYMQSH